MLIECLSAILIILLLIVINGYVQKNRQLPGPFPLPLIGGAYVFFGHLSSERILPKLMDLVNKYGRTLFLRSGSTEFTLISKPEHVQVYCTSPHLLDHAPLYNVLKSITTQGLFISNGASWKAKRRAWTPSFHLSVLRTFVKSFKDQADIFAKTLQQEVNGPEFPLYPYLQEYFFNTILLTQFEFDHKTQSKSRIAVDALETISKIMYQKMFNVFFYNETIFNLSPSGKKVKELKDFCHEYTSTIVERKKMDFANDGVLPDDDGRKKVFIRQLLGVRKVSKEVLLDEIMTMAMTGYETTSHVMGFITLMIGKHQEVQDKVFLEDQEIQRQLNGRELVMDDLDKYEYLDRVIKETLRLFPVAPFMARKAAKDVKMGDVTILKGSSVACVTFALHRNPEIYPNPLVFNPDNFLPERIAERHPYSYVAFSGGPRNCIGIKFAMTSLKVIVSTLVRKYRLFSNKDVEDIKLTSKLVLGDADHFLLRIEERQNELK